MTFFADSFHFILPSVLSQSVKRVIVAVKLTEGISKIIWARHFTLHILNWLHLEWCMGDGKVKKKRFMQNEQLMFKKNILKYETVASEANWKWGAEPSEREYASNFLIFPSFKVSSRYNYFCCDKTWEVWTLYDAVCLMVRSNFAKKVGRGACLKDWELEGWNGGYVSHHYHEGECMW